MTKPRVPNSIVKHLKKIEEAQRAVKTHMAAIEEKYPELMDATDCDGDTFASVVDRQGSYCSANDSLRLLKGFLSLKEGENCIGSTQEV